MMTDNDYSKDQVERSQTRIRDKDYIQRSHTMITYYDHRKKDTFCKHNKKSFLTYFVINNNYMLIQKVSFCKIAGC